MAIGNGPIENPEDKFIIVAEYNKSVQGFLVESVLQIVNTSWEAILPPPAGTGKSNYNNYMLDRCIAFIGITF